MGPMTENKSLVENFSFKFILFLYDVKFAFLSVSLERTAKNYDVPVLHREKGIVWKKFKNTSF